MTDVIYSERQPIYTISIGFGAFGLVFLLLSVLGNFDNELVRLLFLVLVLIFGAIIYSLHQFKITVAHEELRLSFGNGVFKKIYLLSEIDLESFGTKKIPWYYGIGWKYDFSGNVFFNAHSGIALTFQLKHKPGKIMIVGKNRDALKSALISSPKTVDSNTSLPTIK